nr:c-type cytochrome [uncultured Rhodopila sp.]
MRHLSVLCAALAAAAVLAATPARAAGDAKRGADLFADNCGDCHSVKEGGGNRKGPNLFGVIGRKSGTVPGFDIPKPTRPRTGSGRPSGWSRILRRRKRWCPAPS